MDTPPPITTLSTETRFSCEFFEVRGDTVRMPDGKQRPYNYVHFHGCVYVVPVLEDGRIALIRQYRHPVGQWCWEIPAGGIKKGQTPEQAVEAELREEIGGTAGKWTKLGAFHLSNGSTDELGHAFVALGVQIGETAREETEFMETHLLEPEKVLHMVVTNQIADGPSALALLLWSRRQEEIGG